MTTALVLKRGDTKPDLVVTITDPLATFGAVASWKVLIKRGATLFTDTTPTVNTGTAKTAVVTHQWKTAETAVVGTMNVEVEATWPDGAIQTFPCSTYGSVQITQDLV